MHPKNRPLWVRVEGNCGCYVLGEQIFVYLNCSACFVASRSLAVRSAQCGVRSAVGHCHVQHRNHRSRRVLAAKYASVLLDHLLRNNGVITTQSSRVRSSCFVLRALLSKQTTVSAHHGGPQKMILQRRAPSRGRIFLRCFFCSSCVTVIVLTGALHLGLVELCAQLKVLCLIGAAI